MIAQVRLGVDRPMEDREHIMSAKWFHRRCFIEAIQTDEYNDVPLATITPQHFEGWEGLEKAEAKGSSSLPYSPPPPL